MDKELLFSRRKGAQFLREQIINDLVCGFYLEEDALKYYGISPNQLIRQAQKALSNAQMMNGYYRQVIQVAEREFRIEIEKKPPGPGPLPSSQRND